MLVHPDEVVVVYLRRLSRTIGFFVHDRPKVTVGLILLACWILTVIVHAAGVGIATAQTDPITPSGLHTEVHLSTSPTVPIGTVQYDITGGTRPGGGGNLFHSFGDFNVPNNNIANFLNGVSFDLNGNQLPVGLPTSNILGRVTGGDISNILGTIQTTGFGNANLFLMNPNGFLFGQNAMVNVGGMVTFTTADYLKLSNGTNNGYFYADPAGPSLLTPAPVAAFGFLGPNAASIAIQGGTLEVPDGKTLAFIGGPRTFTTDTGSIVPSGVTMTGGSLSAPNGLIYMATVTSPAEVPVPTLSGAPLGALGPPSSDPAVVRIRSGEFVMDQVFLTSTNSSAAARSAIAVNVQGAMTLRNASSISTETFGTGHGSDVDIAAQSLQIDGSSMQSITMSHGPGGNISIGVSGGITLENGSGIFSSALSEGKGGDIQLSAQNVTLNTGVIEATASALAAGGDLTVTAVEAVHLREGSLLHSLTESTKNGGNISIHGTTVAVENGSAIVSESQGSGQGGTITVTAEESILITSPADAEPPSLISSTAGQNLSGKNTTGDGGAVTLSAPSITIGDSGTVQTLTNGSAKAGDITVHTDNDLTMTNAAIIVTSTGSSGPSGTIQITAGGTVSLVGNFASDTSSRIVTRSSSIGQDAGKNGDISIDANRVTLNDGAKIFSDTLNTKGGDIRIQTHDSVQLSGGSRISTTSSAKDAGSLRITGSSITVEGLGTGLSTQSIGLGNAGNISLMATSGSLILSGGSDVKSLTGQGSGTAGAIMASATDSIEISGGAIITSSSFGPAPAGPITISAGNIVSLSGSGTGLFSEAFGRGDGGSISIQGTQVQLTNGAIISAKSGPTQGTAGTGAGGNINIMAGQSMTLNNGSSISTSSTGIGNAGSIDITAGQSFIATNSSVTTQANHASGGAIKITTAPSGTFKLINSLISASVLDGAGGGGSVDIDPLYVILLNSQILANAVQGPGGNIFITTNFFLSDANSVISASSQFGVNGTVTIQSPNAPISGQIQPLGKTPLPATSLLNQHCAALADGQFSSFTVAGRDSLPTEPGNWLASPLYAAGVGLGVKAEGMKAEGEKLETPLLSLRQIAPAGFLTQAFAVEGSSSCQS